jgi:hypothetical protein
MKAKIPNSSRLDILGNGHKSDQEIFSSVLKQWRQKLGYCSIVAAVPALLASSLPVSRSVEAKKPQARVIGQETRNLAKLDLDPSQRVLLKRQSEFRLPHQKESLGPLSGNDDCPGRAIPGGTYTAATPYIDSGNTTGANNTVGSICGAYCYYFNDAAGPDQIYSFTLTALGANPRIEVTATSATYDPLIYIVDSNFQIPACPGGTNNTAWSVPWLTSSSPGPTETIPLDFAPLGRPLILFVDSVHNDASGSGPYTIRMQDVTIAPVPSPNQIDETQFFVRQHYRDFLSREPDPEGLAFWVNQITSCGGDQGCLEINRINDSGSFFFSIEFQETGYLAYRMYKTAFGPLPKTPVPITFNEFIPDTQALGRDVIVNQPGWEQVLENNKRIFTAQFVDRPRFKNAFPPAMAAREVVDTLNSNASFPLSVTERDQLISDLSGGRRSRADVLRVIAEHPKLVQIEFNRAFVLMQYFGYLRRNPNDAPDGDFAGYNFWLEKLNSFNGDFIQAEMVKAFISSTEYRKRFGP